MITAITPIQPGDSKKTNAKYAIWHYSAPLPPDSLMWSVGGANIENFLVIAEAWSSLVSRYTRPDCVVLDIGCGCGRTARHLLSNRFINAYIGFDVIKENIEWCQNFLTPTFIPKSTFTHHDIYSKEYNPSGAILAKDFVFPAENSSIDVAFAASLFTHLLEDDCIQYLKETSRALKINGVAILSIHTNSGDFNYIGTETRVDINKDYFVSLANDQGLDLIDYITDFGGQQVCIFKKG
jgi:SAM-dependent methyltransferase